MAFTPSRRSLLQGVGVAASVLLVARGAGATSSSRTGGIDLPRRAEASWLRRENELPGDGSWLHGIAESAGHLEGYASGTSVNLGDSISIFVSTNSPTLRAKVFRMGYYQGLGARLIETREGIKGSDHPIPSPDQFGTVECRWPSTFTLQTDRRYQPGQYLVRLEHVNNEYRFVPFVVRDDASHATYVYLSAVTTWQAYNAWGGYSLYGKTNPTVTTTLSNAARAVRVSFNRPYDREFANGAADFIGNEFPFLFFAERLGLDMTYWTDIDLHENGARLTRHRALLSLGHDEYYSPAMRHAVTRAVNHGTNVAFLGANFCYRKIRFAPSLNGANRLMINYRSTTDPIMKINPALATVNWSQYPSDAPESAFSGSIYGGVDGTGSLRVVDASSWLWRGTDLVEGAALPNALGGEFNHFNPSGPSPPNVQLFGHSYVGSGLSDVTYVAQPGRGGVFTSGTGQWIYRMSDSPRLGGHWIPDALANVTTPLQIATQNLLALFAMGPAGTVMASVANTNRFY